MTPEWRAKVQQQADNLQISLYIRDDGTVHQRPPGELVEFKPNAPSLLDHGHSTEKPDEPSPDP